MDQTIDKKTWMMLKKRVEDMKGKGLKTWMKKDWRHEKERVQDMKEKELKTWKDKDWKHERTRIADMKDKDWRQESKRIEAAGGKVFNGRVNGNLGVARSIGDKCYKVPPGDLSKQMVTCHPVIKVLDLSNYNPNFILLACDGIWECKKN